ISACAVAALAGRAGTDRATAPAGAVVGVRRAGGGAGPGDLLGARLEPEPAVRPRVFGREQFAPAHGTDRADAPAGGVATPGRVSGARDPRRTRERARRGRSQCRYPARRWLVRVGVGVGERSIFAGIVARG